MKRNREEKLTQKEKKNKKLKKDKPLPDLVPEIGEIISEYITYTEDNIPDSDNNMPYSLSDISYVFLYLTNQEDLTIKGVSESDDISEKELYLKLIQISPEYLFITPEVLDDAAKYLNVESIKSDRMCKYADKYGDNDGYVGYCDFLNITKHAKLW